MRAIIRFWAIVGFALTLFGIFWVPKDIADWKQAAQPWMGWLAMVDQNSALWAFSIALFIYIATVEFLPKLRSVLRKDSVYIAIHKAITKNEIGDNYKTVALQLVAKNLGKKSINNLRIRVDRVLFTEGGNDRKGLMLDKYLSLHNLQVYLGPREWILFESMGIDDSLDPFYIGRFIDGDHYRPILPGNKQVVFSAFDGDQFCGKSVVQVDFHGTSSIEFTCTPNLKDEHFVYSERLGIATKKPH